MTVVLPKLESVPDLNPQKLSLRDPACKPFYSDDHVAYFHFALSDCGTSRTVLEGDYCMHVVTVHCLTLCLFSLLGIPSSMRMK